MNDGEDKLPASSGRVWTRTQTVSLCAQQWSHISTTSDVLNGGEGGLLKIIWSTVVVVVM